MGVGAVIVQEGRVVLIKRKFEPLAGQWSLPGGTLELGETLETGVAREIHEETGLEIEVGPVVEVFDRILLDPDGRVRYHFVLIDYLCRPIGGRLAAGSDVADAVLASPGELAGYRMTPKRSPWPSEGCGWPPRRSARPRRGLSLRPSNEHHGGTHSETAGARHGRVERHRSRARSRARARGYDLVITARNQPALDQVARELSSTYRAVVHAVSADLASPRGAHELVQEIASAGVTVDVLVNNAGFGLFGLFARTPLESEQRMIDLNISALVTLTKLSCRGCWIAAAAAC